MRIRIEVGRCKRVSKDDRFRRIRDRLATDLNHYDGVGLPPARITEIARNIEREL